MISFSFRPGVRFIDLTGVIWTLKRVCRNAFHFAASDGSRRTLTQGAAQSLYRECSWRLDPSSAVRDRPLCYPVTERDFESYAEAARERAKWKRKVVECVEKHKISLTKKSVTGFLPTLRREVGSERRLSASSVLRWCAKWKATPQLSALIDGRRVGSSSRPLFDVPPELVTAAWENITAPRPRASDLLRELEKVINAHNEGRPKEERLELVPSSTLYRHLEQLLTQIGIKRARRNPGDNSATRNAIGSVTVSRVLERVEIDFHKLDIVPVSTVTRKPIERAWIIVAIDCYSRMILGLYLTLDPPNARAVVECLRHATLPKDPTRARFPSLRSPYPAAGIPELVTTDNGTEMWADMVEEACAQLKLPFRYCPGEMPEMKAYIERFFKTLAKDAIHTAPGTTFSNPVERGDYDSNKHAAYDIERLTERIVLWIVDKYHRKPHRAIKCSPLRMWTGSPRLAEIEFPADPMQFDILACEQKERTLQHYGIEDDHCYYNSDVLADIFERLDRVPTKVLVKRPDCINYIYVRNPFTFEYFKVPARKGAPDFPLPRFLHRAILKDLASCPEAKEDKAVALQADDKLNEMNRVVVAENRKRKRAVSDRHQQPDSTRIINGEPSRYEAAKRSIAPRPPRQAVTLVAGLDDDLPAIGTI